MSPPGHFKRASIGVSPGQVLTRHPLDWMEHPADRIKRIHHPRSTLPAIVARSRSAVTFLELLAVMLILAIVCGLLIPSAQSDMPHYLRTAAEVLAADLAFARSLAIVAGQPTAVVFEADGDAYRIVHSQGAQLSQSPFTWHPGQLTFRLSEMPQAGRFVRLLRFVPDAPSRQRRVDFTTLGGLASSEDVRIILGTPQAPRAWMIEITISAVTGRCHVGPPFLE